MDPEQDAIDPPSEAPDAGPSPRQTQGYLKDLLSSFGLDPKKRLGQNFLIDLNLLDLIVRSADITPDDFVLEVGSGTGSLTALIAEKAGRVLSVEIDRDFQRMLRRTLSKFDNVELYSGDVLHTKNELNPEVLAAADRICAEASLKRRKLIANLPYVVATPVMANILIDDRPLHSMVVMVQWEMAARLAAKPGTSDYGALTVLVQNLADVEIIRRLSPAAFWPRPQVDSAIIKIVANPEKRSRLTDVKGFRAFLRDLYTHRRKNLRQGLVGWPSGRFDKTAVDAMLTELKFDGSGRAEDLDLAEHRTLFEAFDRWGVERLRQPAATRTLEGS